MVITYEENHWLRRPRGREDKGQAYTGAHYHSLLNIKTIYAFLSIISHPTTTLSINLHCIFSAYKYNASLPTTLPFFPSSFPSSYLRERDRERARSYISTADIMRAAKGIFFLMLVILGCMATMLEGRYFQGRSVQLHEASDGSGGLFLDSEGWRGMLENPDVDRTVPGGPNGQHHDRPPGSP
ncbi:hypothetical protein ACLOJK_010458 [Asimina triloba]